MSVCVSFALCARFDVLSQGADFLKSPVHIIPSRASKSAIKAVEARGGSVFCQYYNSLALRDCVKGRTDRISASPTRRNDIREFFQPFRMLSCYIFTSLVHRVAKPRLSVTRSGGEDPTRVGTLEGAVKAASCIQNPELHEEASCPDYRVEYRVILIHYTSAVGSASILSDEMLRLRECEGEREGVRETYRPLTDEERLLPLSLGLLDR
jgi:hypothetical protein